MKQLSLALSLALAIIAPFTSHDTGVTVIESGNFDINHLVPP